VSERSPISFLQTVADREAALLASFAMHSRDSRGRKHPEAEHSYRGPYQRDRDRILHSHAFRRLAGKMQVFTGDMGDYHRTRLTHTHEVASIARTMGRALRLNEDLIEALALFHDIGHPPYGHAGEDALNECLKDHGGFSHNRNALVIAEELEIRYPGFAGLNLSHEVLEGQRTRADKTQTYGPATKSSPGPLLEVQAVEAADSMTYDAHDSDDAVKLGLVTMEELQETQLGREAVAVVRGEYANLSDDILRKSVIHALIDRQVTEVLQHSAAFLATCGNLTTGDVRQLDFRIGPPPELAEQKRELERFLYERVYRHPRLVAVRTLSQERLRTMYEGYLRRPELLPPHFQLRVPLVGLERTAGEYLAGMTDRFCEGLYQKYFVT
jgi:dGTPase